MRATWLVVVLVLSCIVTGSDEADAQSVLIGFANSLTRAAVDRAATGARERLRQAECRRVLSDFQLEPPSDVRLQSVRFLDDSDAPICRHRPEVMAFTEPGSNIVRVCGPQFRERASVSPTYAEILVIHEFLHVLGLGENPPSSQAITAQVATRCGK